MKPGFVRLDLVVCLVRCRCILASWSKVRYESLFSPVLRLCFIMVSKCHSRMDLCHWVPVGVRPSRVLRWRPMDEDGSCRVLTFFMSSQITSGDVESGDVDEEAILSYI